MVVHQGYGKQSEDYLRPFGLRRISDEKVLSSMSRIGKIVWAEGGHNPNQYGDSESRELNPDFQLRSMPSYRAYGCPN